MAWPARGILRRLDPDAEQREAWNRGASFVAFQWLDPGLERSISSTQADIVVVRVDPCEDVLQEFELRMIAAGRELWNPCLVERGTTRFGGIPRWFYEIERNSETTRERGRHEGQLLGWRRAASRRHRRTSRRPEFRQRGARRVHL